METINPKQLSIILDWTVEKALFHFYKLEQPPAEIEADDLPKLWFVAIDEIESIIGINLQKLINDVKQNFTKNKACTDYVMKYIASKVKASKTGVFPRVISFPQDVNFLLTDEQRSFLAERALDYLPSEKVNLIKKHQIRIA